MSDVVLVVVIVGFFAAAALLVRAVSTIAAGSNEDAPETLDRERGDGNPR
jgi:hypothetical protein